MKLNLKSRQLIDVIKGTVFFNIFFLAGTSIFSYYYYHILNTNWENGSKIKYFLKELSLATENVLATWYSSMLFLSVGIIFFICYLLQKKDLTIKSDKKLSYGWLIFAGIFTLLSLDEMASLHERVGNINALNPLGDYPLGWVLLMAVPIILVACFMIWFCLLQVKRAPIAAFFAVAGIFLFGSVLVQEYFEIQAWEAVGHDEIWQRPIGFLLLEEGSELFGATFMLISGMLFAYYLSTGKAYTLGSAMEIKLQFNSKNTVFQFATGLLILALLMLPIVHNDLLILEGDHGKREIWIPAATAFFTSLLCLYLYFKNSHTGKYRVFLYLSIFSLFMSAYFGGDIYSYMYNPFDSYYKLLLLAFLIVITTALAIKVFVFVKYSFIRAGIMLWMLLLIPAFFIFSWYSAALVFTGFSILSISLLHKITFEVPVPSVLPVTGKNSV